MTLHFSENAKKDLVFTLIIATHLVFSYNYFKGWWYSALGSSLIILFSYFIWPKSFLKNIGLSLRQSSVFLTFLLSVIIIILSYIMSDYIAAKQGILITFSNWHNYFHDVFYTLNEEIILGALLLFYCLKKYKTHPLIISALLAVFFAVVHFIFYKWIFDDAGIIEPLTLIALLVIGFMRNNLIITFGHIGYSWAFHFGWIVIMLGSNHNYIISGKKLTEPQLFNSYLGSPEMLGVAIIMSGLSVWLYLSKNKSSLKYNK